MAYCNECGAYIPDGHTKCLACGYDETESVKKAAEEKASAQAYDYKYEEPRRVDNDFLKQQLEEQRRRQQENSRKWAETEQAQRRKTQQEQEKYSYTAGTRSTDTKKYTAPTNLSASKILAALSYFGILFIIPYLLYKEDGFAMYHAKQGMILFIAGIAAEVLGSIFGLGWLAGIAKLYFIYKGVKAVLEGKKEPLPYIGTLI